MKYAFLTIYRDGSRFISEEFDAPEAAWQALAEYRAQILLCSIPSTMVASYVIVTSFPSGRLSTDIPTQMTFDIK